MHDWDYMISNPRYYTPWQLKHGKWPPDGVIKLIYADKVPICAVIQRKTKADHKGFLALERGNNQDALRFLQEAVNIAGSDEMIFYNFAIALNRSGMQQEANNILIKCLELNPGFEPVLMYLGNLNLERGDTLSAENFYRKLIELNRKYYDAWEALDRIETSKSK
jgi:tetratricopeptide (TPR) repeat protein